MSHKAKSDAEWNKDLTKYALTGEMGGGGWPKQPGKPRDDYYAIRKCPLGPILKGGGGGQVTITDAFRKGPPKKVSCTCGFHTKPKKNNATDPSTNKSTNKPSTNDQKKRKAEVFELPKEFELPKKQEAISQEKLRERTDKGQKYAMKPWDTIKKPGYLDHFVFFSMAGRCPKCGDTTNVKPSSKGKSIFVYSMCNDDHPYTAQSLGMVCWNQTKKEGCKEYWQGLDARYVAALPPHMMLKVPVFKYGKARGIDKKIVTLMRLGNTGKSTERLVKANLHIKVQHEALCHQSIKVQQENLFHQQASATRRKTAVGFVRVTKYDVPKEWLPPSTLIIEAFVNDHLVHKRDLWDELCTVKAQLTMSVDDQRKVVLKTKKDKSLGREGEQAGTLNNHLGKHMNKFVHDSSSPQDYTPALDEAISRHLTNEEVDVASTDEQTSSLSNAADKVDDSADADAVEEESNNAGGPKYLCVDCGCCNGKLSLTPATNKVLPLSSTLTRWHRNLILKLDPCHLMMRITREFPSDHPRTGWASGLISKSIFVEDPTTVRELEKAQAIWIEKHKPAPLTPQMKRKDRKNGFIAKMPAQGKEMATSFLKTIAHLMFVDRRCRDRALLANMETDNVITTHIAYPLITGKVLKVAMDQVNHMLNGCLSYDPTETTCIKVRDRCYRDTGYVLGEYISIGGTSRSETCHSSEARHFVNMSNVRKIYWDAKMMWQVIHFNRRKDVKYGIETIPEGMAPKECIDAKIAPRNSKPILFGWDYYYYLRALKNEKYTNTYSSQKPGLEAQNDKEREEMFAGVEESDDGVLQEENNDDDDGDSIATASSVNDDLGSFDAHNPATHEGLLDLPLNTTTMDGLSTSINAIKEKLERAIPSNFAIAKTTSAAASTTTSATASNVTSASVDYRTTHRSNVTSSATEARHAKARAYALSGASLKSTETTNAVDLINSYNDIVPGVTSTTAATAATASNITSASVDDGTPYRSNVASTATVVDLISSCCDDIVPGVASTTAATAKAAECGNSVNQGIRNRLLQVQARISEAGRDPTMEENIQATLVAAERAASKHTRKKVSSRKAEGAQPLMYAPPSFNECTEELCEQIWKEMDPPSGGSNTAATMAQKLVREYRKKVLEYVKRVKAGAVPPADVKGYADSLDRKAVQNWIKENQMSLKLPMRKGHIDKECIQQQVKLDSALKSQQKQIPIGAIANYRQSNATRNLQSDRETTIPRRPPNVTASSQNSTLDPNRDHQYIAKPKKGRRRPALPFVKFSREKAKIKIAEELETINSDMVKGVKHAQCNLCFFLVDDEEHSEYRGFAHVRKNGGIRWCPWAHYDDLHLREKANGTKTECLLAKEAWLCRTTLAEKEKAENKISNKIISSESTTKAAQRKKAPSTTVPSASSPSRTVPSTSADESVGLTSNNPSAADATVGDPSNNAVVPPPPPPQNLKPIAASRTGIPIVPFTNVTMSPDLIFKSPSRPSQKGIFRPVNSKTSSKSKMKAAPRKKAPSDTDTSSKSPKKAAPRKNALSDTASGVTTKVCMSSNNQVSPARHIPASRDRIRGSKSQNLKPIAASRTGIPIVPGTSITMSPSPSRPSQKGTFRPVNSKTSSKSTTKTVAKKKAPSITNTSSKSTNKAAPRTRDPYDTASGGVATKGSVSSNNQVSPARHMPVNQRSKSQNLKSIAASRTGIPIVPGMSIPMPPDLVFKSPSRPSQKGIFRPVNRKKKTKSVNKK